MKAVAASEGKSDVFYFIVLYDIVHIVQMTGCLIFHSVDV